MPGPGSPDQLPAAAPKETASPKVESRPIGQRAKDVIGKIKAKIGGSNSNSGAALAEIAALPRLEPSVAEIPVVATREPKLDKDTAQIEERVVAEVQKSIADHIVQGGDPHRVLEDIAGKDHKEDVLVRGKELLTPSGTVTYKGEGFEHLFERGDITLTGRLAEKTEQGEGEKTYEAVTIGEMGREAGWEIQFENTANGHRFNFLGIKGVGLTKAGRRFLELVKRPKTYAQRVGGKGPTAIESYDITDSAIILPREGAEEQAVLGLVGEEEILNDVTNASRLASEKVWTAEPVAVVVENTDRPEVTEAKRRGLIKPETKEAREVRAYRSPERLNKLHILLGELRRFGGGDRNLKQGIEQFMQRGTQYLKNIDIPLENYPGANEMEKFVSWSFEKAGEQAGTLSRLGFRHDNLTDFQNFTSLLEVVDLGEQTEWVGDVRIHPEVYFDLYAGAASLYAAGAITNGHNPNLEAGADLYVKSFITAYTQNPENIKRVQELYGGKNSREGSTYTTPEIIIGSDDIVSLTLSLWENLPLGALPEGTSGRVIEWPEGKSVKIRTYNHLIRYYLGKALRTEAVKLADVNETRLAA